MSFDEFDRLFDFRPFAFVRPKGHLHDDVGRQVRAPQLGREHDVKLKRLKSSIFELTFWRLFFLIV